MSARAKVVEAREDGNTLDSRVAISCIASVQLIAISNPIKTSLCNVVEGHQIVVSGYTMNSSDTNFMQTLEEVLGHVNWLLQ